MANILILSDFIYPVAGGTEKATYEAAEFLSHKNKVRVICPVWTASDPLENIKYMKISDNFDIIKFNLPFKKNQIFKSVYFIIYALLYGRDYEIIHAQYYGNGLIAAVLKLLLKKKAFCIIQDFENIEKRGIMSVNIINKLDRIIISTPILKEFAASKGMDRNKLIVCPNWTEIKKLNYNQEQLKKKHGLLNNRVILFVGRVQKSKGIKYLIRSIPAVIQKCKNAKFVFAGKLIENEMVELAKNSGVYGHCRFTDFVSEKELDEYYSLCDIFVLPSIAKEGFGFVLAEAMAHEKPVIGTTFGGMPYVIGDSGIIVPQGDSEALGKAIISLMKNDKLRKSLAIKGRQRVVKMFEKEKVLKKYERILLKKYD